MTYGCHFQSLFSMVLAYVLCPKKGMQNSNCLQFISIKITMLYCWFSISKHFVAKRLQKLKQMCVTVAQWFSTFLGKSWRHVLNLNLAVPWKKTTISKSQFTYFISRLLHCHGQVQFPCAPVFPERVYRNWKGAVAACNRLAVAAFWSSCICTSWK